MFFFFQAEDGIRDSSVTGVQTCALPICLYPALSAEVPNIVAAAAGIEAIDVFRAMEFRYRGERSTLGAGDIEIVRRHGRSEERRVGKEGRSRWSPYH